MMLTMLEMYSDNMKSCVSGLSLSQRARRLCYTSSISKRCRVPFKFYSKSGLLKSISPYLVKRMLKATKITGLSFLTGLWENNSLHQLSKVRCTRQVTCGATSSKRSSKCLRVTSPNMCSKSQAFSRIFQGPPTSEASKLIHSTTALKSFLTFLL